MSRCVDTYKYVFREIFYIYVLSNARGSDHDSKTTTGTITTNKDTTTTATIEIYI